MNALLLIAALLSPSGSLAPSGLADFSLAPVSSPGPSDRTVLGRLGQTIRETNIFAKPSADSEVYFHANAFTYMVLKPSDKKGWKRVLLQNGQFGYLRANSTTDLPYLVTAGRSTSTSERGAPKSREEIARFAVKFVGTPYKKGGNDLRHGIDSGHFVSALMHSAGIDIPADPAKQAQFGSPVRRLEDLKAGDRVYFWSKRLDMIGTTAMYLGNGYCIAALPERGQVSTFYLGEKRVLGDLVAARR